MLSSRGQRDMDSGPEEITDAAVRAQVRRQARKVYLESAISALVLAAAVTLLPRLF
jgi:hypothetical protein